MKLPDISTSEYEDLARAITSTESPVGIDAKKTHVVILHLLLEMNQRLERLEKRLDGNGSKRPTVGGA